MQTLQQTVVSGEPSLQNSLELATKLLKLLPSHASKEILVIVGALTTCDPGDINETIQVCFVYCMRVRARVYYLCVVCFVFVPETYLSQYLFVCFRI